MVLLLDISTCTTKTLSPFLNFFCSKEYLEKWLEKKPAPGKGEMYQLHKVLEHGIENLQKSSEIDRQRYVEDKDEQNN